MESDERYAEYRFVESDVKWGSCPFDNSEMAMEKAERLLQSRPGIKGVEVWSLLAVITAKPIETKVELVWRDRPKKEEED